MRMGSGGVGLKGGGRGAGWLGGAGSGAPLVGERGGGRASVGDLRGCVVPHLPHERSARRGPRSLRRAVAWAEFVGDPAPAREEFAQTRGVG